MTVSYFRNINQYVKEVSINEIIKQIQSDQSLKNKISQIRAAKDKAEKNKLKLSLPAITTSGVFDKAHKKEAFIKHSGLLQIDIDAVENPAELKETLKKDPYTFVAFISPSGNGLKLIVKIPADEQKHLQSFEALQLYYLQKYGLQIDEKTKDISRLMFLSYDPEIFVNEKAQTFVAPEPENFSGKLQHTPVDGADTGNNFLPPEADKNFPEAPEPEKLVCEIEQVIKQAEARKIDFCPSYSEWLTVCFALADGLQEKGRQFFNRISNLYGKEQKIKPDKQFDYCLKYRKNNGIAPFFAQAKKYGLNIKFDICRQSENDILAPLPKNYKKTLDKYDFEIKNGCYYVKNKNNLLRVSNFTMQVLLNIDDDTNDSIKILKFQRYDQQKPKIKSLKSSQTRWTDFKTFMRSNGLSFTGNARTFELIWEYLLEKEKQARLIDFLGWNSENRFYAFANAILDTNGTVYKPDELGLIKYGDQLFYLPAVSLINQNDKSFEAFRRFFYQPGHLNFQQFINLFFSAYGLNGAVGLMYFILSIFRDVVFDTLSFFPFLFLYGEAETGKTSFVNFLTSAFGTDKGLPLSSTGTALFREITNRFNQIIYIKEYSNNLRTDIENFILTAYDGTGKAIGLKTTDARTKKFVINSSIILDGNEPPFKTNAIYSRMLMLTFFKPTQKEQKESFLKLKEAQKKGFGNIISELLRFRKYFEKNFKEAFFNVYKQIDDNNKIKLDNRLKNHLTLFITPFEMFKTLYKFPFSDKELKNHLYNAVKEQQEIINENNDFSFVLKSLEYAKMKALPISEVYEIEKKKGFALLYLNFNSYYNLVYLYYNRETKQETKLHSEIKKILRTYAVKTGKNKKFSDGKIRRSYVFKLKYDTQTEEISYNGQIYDI